MVKISLQIVFIVFFCIIGYLIALDRFDSGYFAVFGAGLGVILAFMVIILEQKAAKCSLGTLIGAGLGAMAGLIIANLFLFILLPELVQSKRLDLFIYVILNASFLYLGLGQGIKRGKKFDLSGRKSFTCSSEESAEPKILDTSVIIDGRIADLCKTGFIEGTVMLPQFVLHELQRIADSSDSMKRTRGRRGLDILKKIQKQVDVNVQIIEDDFPKIKEVDAKLVALAKKIFGKLVTNDYNLNKVAELQGVRVLNINQLAIALRPVVLPGEIIKVSIVKEGKEGGQGIAYLDDGTMVVVGKAIKHLGKSVNISVTSVLQTTAGRMIFAVLKEDFSNEHLYLKR